MPAIGIFEESGSFASHALVALQLSDGIGKTLCGFKRAWCACEFPTRNAMASQRKKHVQQSFEYRTHGGKRPNAGRPRKGERRPAPHTERKEIDERVPLHITSRVVADLGSSLRKKDTYLAIRRATLAVFEREGFRLVHASIQYNHLHLLVEADDKDKLAAGLQVFLSVAAIQLNRALWRRTGDRRRGRVFAERYDIRVLATPRQVRNALAYVLNNFRRHGEDQAMFARAWKVDPYSSGVYFTGWSELGDSPFALVPPAGYLGLLTKLPRTWLLRVGWMKSGGVSVYEVPGRS
jgi:REP element-mobilizing transposase RayT